MSGIENRDVREMMDQHCRDVAEWGKENEVNGDEKQEANLHGMLSDLRGQTQKLKETMSESLNWLRGIQPEPSKIEGMKNVAPPEVNVLWLIEKIRAEMTLCHEKAHEIRRVIGNCT